MYKSYIQWTDHTVNFWTGCQKVSAGCENCYMHRIEDANGNNPKLVRRNSEQYIGNQLKKAKAGDRIFTCSMSDFFIKEADMWRKDAWDIIRKNKHLNWQILTKRPERIKECLPEDWGEGWDHVWLGVSIENQKYMYRLETLAKIPAKTRFISAEPLIGEVDFAPYPDVLKDFHWCIVGGESGNEEGKFSYRECKIEWVEKIIQDLRGSSVKIFVKQTGTHFAKQTKLSDKHGGKMEEWPASIQVREFPAINAPISMAAAGSIEGLPVLTYEEGIRKKWKPIVFNGAELLNMGITEMPSLVKPIIPKVGVVALAGTSDIGKSRLLLQLCTDIVLNDKFLGFTIDAKHKSVIYVPTEDDHYAISNRLQVHVGVDEEKIGRLRFLFSTEHLLTTLDEMLTKQKADAVVIDTFTDLYSGEMNQVNKVRAYMNDFYQLAIKHGCVVIFNHHTVKRSEENPPNKNNLIGSQGFEGKARLVMELRQDYSDSKKRHLCIVKGNYIKDEHKKSSFEMLFDEKTGFTLTGQRVPFEQLAKPKDVRPTANQVPEPKRVAIELKKQGKSNSEIIAALKTIGHNVAKSTLSDWVKGIESESDQQSDDKMSGQAA